VGLVACSQEPKVPELPESVIVADMVKTPGYPNKAISILNNTFSLDHQTTTRTIVNGELNLEMELFDVLAHYSLIYNLINDAWVLEQGYYTQDKIHNIKTQPDLEVMESKFKEELDSFNDVKVLSVSTLDTNIDLENGTTQSHFAVKAIDLVEEGYTYSYDSVMIGTYDEKLGWQYKSDVGPLSDESVFSWNGTYVLTFKEISTKESLLTLNQSVYVTLAGSIRIINDGTNKTISVKDPLSGTLTISGKSYDLTPVLGTTDDFYSDVAVEFHWGTGEDEVFTILRGIPKDIGGIVGKVYLISHDGSIAQ